MTLYTTIEINEEDTAVIIDFYMDSWGELNINSITGMDGASYDEEVLQNKINEHVYEECTEKYHDLKADYELESQLMRKGWN